jgi:C4-dicarboxylate-specific signal transduction histidine kinase
MRQLAHYTRLVRILSRDAYVLRNAPQRREAAENSLHQANEDLQERVAERTNKLADQKIALQLQINFRRELVLFRDSSP